MRHIIQRYFEDLYGRVTGPLTFRLILQPGMALFFAIRDGLRDARAENPAYFWALFTGSENRVELIRSGWRSIARVFILAIIMDVIYQIIVFRWFYPFETGLVAIVLAVIPYLLMRGTINRIAHRTRRWEHKRT